MLQYIHMGNIDILALLGEPEEENEAITHRLKVRLPSGRVVPLRKIYDPREREKLIVNLHFDRIVRQTLPEDDRGSRENFAASIIEELDFADDHLLDLTDPRATAFSAERILEGYSLPFQEDELRGDDIIEHEQEPPEILITEEDRVYVSADLLEELIAREKEEDDIFYSPSPRAENHHYRWHREMKDKLIKKNT